VSLRIACDLDGVLADMESALVREARKLFAAAATAAASALSSDEPGGSDADAGIDPEPDSIPSSIRLTLRQERQLWKHVATLDGFWESLDEIEPGSVARLAAAARDRRWEVLFLTKRPEGTGFTSQVQSQRWLAAHGFDLPSVFVLQGSRGRVASALGLDVVVDDRPENCVDVVTDSDARAVLVWRGHREDVPGAARCERLDIVESFEEGLAILQSLGSRAGVVSRMMGRLGFRRRS
jgi:hypothetical protein